MKPSISIIMVNYRSADVLEHCLRSIHGATERAVEVILVDNSPGHGADVVLRESGLTGLYFPQEENIGYTRAANFGAKHASGEFLCFLNPDMMLGPKSLDRLVDWVGLHPRTVAGPRELDADGKIQTTTFPFVTRRYIWGGQDDASGAMAEIIAPDITLACSVVSLRPPLPDRKKCCSRPGFKRQLFSPIEFNLAGSGRVSGGANVFRFRI